MADQTPGVGSVRGSSMAYIEDLARYRYHRGAPKGLAIGWLDSSAPFPTGVCPTDVRDRLAQLATKPVRLMRGFHFCQFCDHPPDADGAALYESGVARGNGEIWVTGTDGINYAAPTLISHYIDAHGYLPPTSFVEAVRDGVPTRGVE